MYDERWLIEECFRYYKHVTDFDDTRVHSDYSVYGSEFINFISSVMTARLIRKFDETGLFAEMTYNDIMSQLATAKKVNTNGDGAMGVRQDHQGYRGNPAKARPASQDGGACKKEKGKTQEGSGP